MTTTKTRTKRVSAEVVETADRILAWLKDRAEPNWEQVLHNAELPGKEAQTNIDRANALGEPMGAVPFGTGFVKEQAGVDGEVGQEAIQHLKALNRIMQVGRGRGRALIIINAEPLNGDAEQVEPVVDLQVDADAPAPMPADEVLAENGQGNDEPAMVPADNLPALLAAVREISRANARRVDEVERELRRVNASKDELQAEITELTESNRALQERLDEQTLGTWR